MTRPDIHRAWEDATRLLSQGAAFAAYREAGKIALALDRVPAEDRETWRTRIDEIRSTADAEAIGNEAFSRLGKATRLASEADSLTDEEAMLLLTILLELKLVGHVLTGPEHAWYQERLGQVSHLLTNLRSSKSFGPRFDRLANTIRRNSGLVL